MVRLAEDWDTVVFIENCVDRFRLEEWESIYHANTNSGHMKVKNVDFQSKNIPRDGER